MTVSVPDHRNRSLNLPLSNYEAATLCGALAYVLDGGFVSGTDDGVLHRVADRLRWEMKVSPPAFWASRPPLPLRPGAVGPCPCECNSGGFCGGCGHAGCGGR